MKAIPIEAQIVRVADVNDALRSKRVYKENFSHYKSIILLEYASSSYELHVLNTIEDIRRGIYIRNYLKQ